MQDLNQIFYKRDSELPLATKVLRWAVALGVASYVYLLVIEKALKVIGG